nr:hypothetical protein [Halobacillus litoralis]
MPRINIRSATNIFRKILSKGDKIKPNIINGTTLNSVTENLEAKSILCLQPQIRHLRPP